jgi:hypothetical protein
MDPKLGLLRLAYKRRLHDLVLLTQQWAAAVEEVGQAANAADPNGDFTDAETDAAEVAIQDVFMRVARAYPSLGAAMAAAVSSTSIDGIPE